MTRRTLCSLVLVGLAFGARGVEASSTDSHRGGAAKDPAKVVGPDKCGECHKSELPAWQASHHARTFLEMHRKPEAQQIVEKLGGKRIKVNPHCLTCHYTEGLRAGQPRAMWGVTCEACHGAARDWVDTHNDFGGKTVTKETETLAHRAKRWEQAEAAGMLRPGNLYAVASNCLQCHSIPDEELVNVGGHTARSDFELLSWSQGEVRHNYQHSGDKKNRAASAERKRLLYVVGAALRLEYSLRAASRATQAGPFVDAAAQGVATARKQLEAIVAAQPIPEITQMLETSAGVSVAPAAAKQAATAAEAVAASARKLASGYDGKAWAGIDRLLPAASAARGEAQP